MSGIATSIEVQDHVSGALNRITASLYSTTAAFGGVDQASDEAFNPTAVQAMTREMYSYENRIQELENNLTGANARLDEMQRQTLENKQAADSLKNAFSSVARTIMGLVSIQQGIGFAKNALASYDTQVEAETKLQTVMTQRMGANEQMIQSVKDLASAQQGLGVVGDEVQLAGAQQLATFMNSSDALNELIPAMNNLAVQQNGASVTGENMTSIANMMGKAMQGQASALTRVGITMTDAEQAALSMGDEEERAAVLAQIITNNVGQMNEAIASTPEGIMQQTANTWGDMMETIGGHLYPAVLRLFQSINANAPQITAILNGFSNGIVLIVSILSGLVNAAGAVAGFFQENWSVISPIIYGVAAALAVYAGYLLYMKLAALASAAAQAVMNSTFLACPLTWIIGLVIALVAGLLSVCNAIADMTGIANSGFGVITGGINVVIQFFKNLGLSVANIALGIGNAIGALGGNIMAAFSNAISSVQSWFYDLLSTAMTVIAGIAKALNELPFVEFDFSGITSAADEYAAKSSAAAKNKKEYKSISEAFNEGSDKFDTFQSGWASDAFSSGAAWGDSAADKLSGLLDGFTGGMDGYGSVGAGGGAGATSLGEELAGNTGETAANTGAIAEAVDVSNENLKYMRDIAEREVINRFTTAEVIVNMGGVSNHVSSGTDLDGVVSYLANGVRTTLEGVAEGVHI